jgi:heat shock protein HslJ
LEIDLRGTFLMPPHMNKSHSWFTLVVLASLVSLVVGCARATAPTSPSSVTSGSNPLTNEQLTGTWSLVSIQSASQAEQAVPQGASYVLTFADGRLSTRADCNICTGPFKLSGQTLTAGPALACTRAACPTMAFESTYTTLLSGDSTVTLSGNTLVLSSARGVLRFAR